MRSATQYSVYRPSKCGDLELSTQSRGHGRSSQPVYPYLPNFVLGVPQWEPIWAVMVSFQKPSGKFYASAERGIAREVTPSSTHPFTVKRDIVCQKLSDLTMSLRDRVRYPSPRIGSNRESAFASARHFRSESVSPGLKTIKSKGFGPHFTFGGRGIITLLTHPSPASSGNR